MVTVLRMATVQMYTKSLSILLSREVGDVNTVAELFKELKDLITTESIQSGLEDPSCRSSVHSSGSGISKHRKV